MFHKEGFNFITISAICIVAGIIISDSYFSTYSSQKIAQLLLLFIFISILLYFKHPKRKTELNQQHIIAPCSGKIIAIEEVQETEYFNDKRQLISIATSPLHIQTTRYAIDGIISFSKHHPKKQLKLNSTNTSSSKASTSVVIKSNSFGEIMYRQIAGPFAKRIVNYAIEGNLVIQGEDAGYCTFGSRVDLVLPLEANISIHIGDYLKGGEQIIANI